MNALSDFRIASPCTASWEQMLGDERERFCNQCQKKVYNLSAMHREDAARFIEMSTGSVCGRIYYRADGTMLTSDCPVGETAWRKQVRLMIGVFVALFIAALGLFATGTFWMSRDGGRSLLPFTNNPKVPPPFGPPAAIVMGEIWPPALPQGIPEAVER